MFNTIIEISILDNFSSIEPIETAESSCINKFNMYLLF